MAGGYSTGSRQSGRRSQTKQPVRSRTAARSRACSNVGIASLSERTFGASDPMAARAVRRNAEHFLVDSAAVCAASRARIRTFSAVGGGNMCGNSVQRRNAPHYGRSLQADSSVTKMNGAGGRGGFPRVAKVFRGGLPVLSRRPVASLVAGSNRFPEVSRRNAFQRLAGRAFVSLGGFRMADCRIQNLSINLRHSAPSLATRFVVAR